MSEKLTPSVRFDGFTNDWELRQASHNVPAVRFTADNGSEFPDWEEKNIGDIGEVITGSTPSTKHDGYFGDEILWATPVDLNDQLVLKNTTRKLSKLGYSKVRKLPEGSVLVSCIASIGKVGVLPVSGSCNQQINAVIPEPDIDSLWLGYAMLPKKPTLEMLGGNGGLKIVNKTLFENMPIFVPSLPEQKKIAACLSSADETIALCRQKLDLLTQAKKALMQQIFSQKLRFKADDGSEFPDWEEKKLGHLCESIASGKTKKSTEGQIPLWGSSGLLGHTKEAEFKGDYLLIGRVGAAGSVRHYVGDFSASDNTLVIKPMIQKISSVWLTEYLEYFNLNRLTFGSSQPLITATQLKRLSVITPKLQEQKKIASCLSSADALIAQARAELEQWQDVKKSLLQQMFV